MHNIKEICQDRERYIEKLKLRNDKTDIDELIKLYETLKLETGYIDADRQRRNEVSKLIGRSKKKNSSGDSTGEEQTREQIDVSALGAEAKQIGMRLKTAEAKKIQIESSLKDILLHIPNLPSDDTPEGLTEKENIIVAEAGSKPSFDFSLRDHLEIAERLEILDFTRGSKITGSGFPVWSGNGAHLERALINFMLDMHSRDHGYREMLTPFMANRASMTGSGQIPHLENDMYHCENEDLFLIPTSEVTLVNLHRDDILAEADLPIKYAAYSPNFRREAGAYGHMTRGFLRVHQFNKVEMVRFEHPENSEDAHEELLTHARTVLDKLELHYRVSQLCAGELSFQAAKCYDLEVWAPADGGRWLEVSSCSNCLDFQARRANIRFRPKEGGKLQYPHTLNGSGLATSRLMVALLETYQTEEGSIDIPAVLRSYMNNKTVITAEREAR